MNYNTTSKRLNSALKFFFTFICPTFFGGSDPPPPPDYVGAAQVQGQSNVEAARATGKMNNPNVFNPYGTQRVTWDGDTPTITQTLSPSQQALFNNSNAAKLILSQGGINAAKNLNGIISNQLDFSGLPNAPISSGQRRNDVIDSMMSRINTDTAGQRDQANSNLIAAGIRPGTPAYQAAMSQIDRQYNDARQQAITAGGAEASRDFGMDQAARNQAISEILQKRSTPLNEVNALQTGSQVSNPFAGNLGFQGGANVQAAPTFQGTVAQGQAAQNSYNQQQAQMNNNISSGAGLIGSLGAAAIKR